MPAKVLADLRRRLDPLARSSSPLSAPPPRETRFGSPLVLSRVHWVKPQLVAEITYLTWTGTGSCGKRFIGASVRPARRGGSARTPAKGVNGLLDHPSISCQAVRIRLVRGIGCNC